MQTPPEFSDRFLLNYAKQVQNDQDHSDDDQNVNPGTKVWQGWNYDRAKKAQQPQDNQNHDDYPQHEVSPFEWSLGTTRR
jgi:hypothetical protein